MIIELCNAECAGINEPNRNRPIHQWSQNFWLIIFFIITFHDYKDQIVLQKYSFYTMIRFILIFLWLIIRCLIISWKMTKPYICDKTAKMTWELEILHHEVNGQSFSILVDAIGCCSSYIVKLLVPETLLTLVLFFLPVAEKPIYNNWKSYSFLRYIPKNLSDKSDWPYFIM